MRAIGRVLRWIWHGLDGLRKILHFLLLLLIFGMIGTLFSRPIPFVPNKAALVIEPQGPIVEQLSGEPLERAVAETLRQAPEGSAPCATSSSNPHGKKRQGISSLYTRPRRTGRRRHGHAAGSRGPRLIISARAASPHCVGELYDQPQLYPRCATRDEIYLDPQGIAYIDGLCQLRHVHQGRARKLYVDWNVSVSASTRSAVEMFTRNDMSPARTRGKSRLAQFDLGT
jgi:protease-4